MSIPYGPCPTLGGVLVDIEFPGPSLPWRRFLKLPFLEELLPHLGSLSCGYTRYSCHFLWVGLSR